ncbi:glycosyltransferase [Patescibacteria group bacterium]
MKKVSIVLPTYNGERYIKESIRSCLDQTYNNLELIVVDDASSDRTSQIIDSFSDKRITYIKNKRNKGLPEALNRGFAVSSGEYLTWQSDDNIFDLKAISTMVGTLEKNQGIDFVYASHYIINKKGDVIGRRKTVSPKILERYNCVGPCFLYRRTVYEQVGGFDPEFFLTEDYEYWLRVKSKFKLQKLDTFLCYYRLHEDSLTSQHQITKIEEQMGKVSSKHISSLSIKHYHEGKLLFYKKDYVGAKKILVKSLFHEPFNSDTWKLLMFSFLSMVSPTIAKKIKKIRE